MKKILIIILFISGTLGYSQNTFRLWHFNAKDGAENAIAALADEYWGDAKFKSGGVQIERIGIGDNEWSHRVIVFGEIGKIGREEGDVDENEWSLFLERFNNHVEEWGTSAAGRFSSYVGAAPKDFPYIQLYEIQVSNPTAFKKAHDKIVSQSKKILGDRPVAFGSFDIGGNGASHWVAVGSKGFEDLMKFKVETRKMEKEWSEYYKMRGPVVNISNFVIEVLKTYGGL